MKREFGDWKIGRLIVERRKSTVRVESQSCQSGVASRESKVRVASRKSFQFSVDSYQLEKLRSYFFNPLNNTMSFVTLARIAAPADRIAAIHSERDYAASPNHHRTFDC